MMMIVRKFVFHQSAKILRRKYSTEWPRKEIKSRLVEKGPSHLYYRGQTPLIHDKTIADQLDIAVENWPHRECVVSIPQNIRLTYSGVLKRVEKIAAGLAKLGLQSGDRLCVWSPNKVEWYLTFLACCKLGIVLVAVNPAYQQSEIEYCLQLVGAKAVVAEDTFKTQNYTRMLLQAKSKIPELEHIIIMSEDHHSGTRRFADVESLASAKEVEAVQDLQRAILPNSACNIQFTSGSTGKPKAATLSHFQLLNNARLAAKRLEFDQKHMKICLNVPFFHAFALLMGQINILHSGATMVIEGQYFNPVKSLETIVKERCNVTYGTPTMWVNLMDAQRKLKLPLTITNGVTGGSPASPQFFKNVRQILKFDNINTIYGLTESTGVNFQSFPEEPYELTENYVGFLTDHIETKVVDDKGISVPFGTPGELWIKGYSVMLGYWNSEKNSTTSITPEKWLQTGDQFILRRDGYGQIVGRLKDMIIRGGENIFPKEIEGHVESHPAVLEAHACGAYDEVFGEEICVCIKLKKDATLKAEELRAYSKGKIAHFKIPRYICFVDDFPKTASGKIQKIKLREMIEEKGLIPPKPKDTI